MDERKPAGRTLSELVRGRLRELGLTQTELASAVGVSQSTISNILRRSRRGYTVLTLRKLAQGLGLDMTEVLSAQEREANLPEELKQIDRELASARDELLNQPFEVKRDAVVYLRRLLGRSRT